MMKTRVSLMQLCLHRAYNFITFNEFLFKIHIFSVPFFYIYIFHLFVCLQFPFHGIQSRPNVCIFGFQLTTYYNFFSLSVCVPAFHFLFIIQMISTLGRTATKLLDYFWCYTQEKKSVEPTEHTSLAKHSLQIAVRINQNQVDCGERILFTFCQVSCEIHEGL